MGKLADITMTERQCSMPGMSLRAFQALRRARRLLPRRRQLTADSNAETERKKGHPRCNRSMAKGPSWGGTLQMFEREEMHER